MRPPNPNTTSLARPPNQTIKADHHRQSRTPDQIRSPHQTTVHHPPNRTVYSASFKWYRSGAFFMGWVKGGYIVLWMNLAKHTFHTLSAWVFRTFFRLNLTLVSLANGVPWAGKGLPFPFSLDGFLCRCSVSNKNSAFRNRFGFFGFFDSASIQGNGSAASFCAFSDGRHHCCFSRRRRRRLRYDLPLSCANLNLFITLHLTVYALRKWSFHSQGSTRWWLF